MASALAQLPAGVVVGAQDPRPLLGGQQLRGRGVVAEGDDHDLGVVAGDRRPQERQLVMEVAGIERRLERYRHARLPATPAARDR